MPTKRKRPRSSKRTPEVVIKVASPWMDSEEARQYLRLKNLYALYRLVEDESLPAYRVGKRPLVFAREELDAWIRSRKVGGGDKPQ